MIQCEPLRGVRGTSGGILFAPSLVKLSEASQDHVCRSYTKRCLIFDTLLIAYCQRAVLGRIFPYLCSQSDLQLSPGGEPEWGTLVCTAGAAALTQKPH